MSNDSPFSLDEDYGSEIIEEGEHIAQITKAFLTESRKGDPMIALRWTIVEDAQKGLNWREYIICKKVWYGYGKLQRICRATGIQAIDKDPAGLNPLVSESVTRNMLGKVCIVETKNQDTEGNDGRKFTNAQSEEYSRLPREAVKLMLATYDDGEPPLPDDSYQDFDGRPLDGFGSNGEDDTTYYDADVPF